MCDRVEHYGLISVIIPVYNVEAYLKQCVDSVLTQTYQQYEVILVDDGSTDRSGQICDDYAALDDRIHVIHQKNSGLSDARNAGLDAAKGAFVYFLDSDDWIEADALAALAKTITSENADVVFFDSLSFDDAGKGYQIPQKYVRKHQYSTDTGLKVFEQQQINREFHSAVPLLFIRKAFLEQTGIRFYSKILYEDMIFTFKVLVKANIAAQCRKSFYQRRYRMNSITMSRLQEKNYVSSAVVFQEITSFSIKEKLTENEYVNQYIVRCAYRMIDIYSKQSNDVKEKYSDRYQKLLAEIIDNKGFGDPALLMRCKSKYHWIIYKASHKLLFWRKK